MYRLNYEVTRDAYRFICTRHVEASLRKTFFHCYRLMACKEVGYKAEGSNELRAVFMRK